MSAENPNPDPYDLVIADLLTKRDQIDRTIEMLTALREGRAPMPAQRIGPLAAAEAASGPGAYLGMTIPDAAKKLLAAKREPMGNADIHADPALSPGRGHRSREAWNLGAEGVVSESEL